MDTASRGEGREGTAVEEEWEGEKRGITVRRGTCEGDKLRCDGVGEVGVIATGEEMSGTMTGGVGKTEKITSQKRGGKWAWPDRVGMNRSGERDESACDNGMGKVGKAHHPILQTRGGEGKRKREVTWLVTE